MSWKMLYRELWLVACKSNVVPMHAMKEYRSVQVKLHSLLTSILDQDEWSGLCSSYNLRSTLAFAWKDWEKSHRTSVRIASKRHRQDSNQAFPEYKSRVLLQHQPTWHHAPCNNTTSERAVTSMVCSIFCITENQNSTRVRTPPHEKSI